MSQKSHSLRHSNFSSAIANTSFFHNGDGMITKYLETSVQNQNDVISSSNSVLEDTDPHLTNWEKWLNIHKTQQEKLSVKLRRKPECMVMNSVYNSLYVNQDKKVITEAINLVSCDKYRGHPNYWNVNSNFERYGEPLAPYQTIEKRYDRSRPNDNKEHPYCPKIQNHDFVGISDAIYKEKGLSGPCLPTFKKKWDESEHVIRLKNNLKENLRKFEPSTTEVADLIILGTSITKPGSFPTKTSSQCGSMEMPQTIPSIHSVYESIGKCKETLMKVVIDGSELAAGSNVWSLFFDTCVLNQINKMQITIQNLEDTVIRYNWEFIMPQWIGSTLPLKHVKKKSKCFYFDKSDGVIFPGSQLNLIFNFVSDTPGVFHESWEFHYGHRHDEWFKMPVELSAVAVYNEKHLNNIKEIDSYINACTRYTIARKTVEELLQRNKPNIPGALPYNRKFFEEEIFAFNNPDLFYDSTEVRILKKIHQNINNNKEPWDYSVKHLRELLLHKSLDQDMKNEIELYSYTVSKLMKANLPLALPNEKTKIVYELLCCFVNRLDAEGQQLRVIYKIPVILNLNHDFESLPSKVSLKGSKTYNMSIKKVKSSFINAKSKTSKGGSRDIFPIKSISSSDSIMALIEDENHTRIRRQEYLETLYIKTYHYLGQTLDQISSVIDSFDLQHKNTALNALKNGNVYRS